MTNLERQYIQKFMSEALEKQDEDRIKDLVINLKKDPRISSISKSKRPYGYILIVYPEWAEILNDKNVPEYDKLGEDVAKAIKEADLWDVCRYKIKRGDYFSYYDEEFAETYEEADKILQKDGWTLAGTDHQTYRLDTLPGADLILAVITSGKNQGKVYLTLNYSHMERGVAHAFDVSQTDQELKKLVQKVLADSYNRLKKNHRPVEAKFIFGFAKNPAYKKFVSKEMLEVDKEVELN